MSEQIDVLSLFESIAVRIVKAETSELRRENERLAARDAEQQAEIDQLKAQLKGVPGKTVSEKKACELLDISRPTIKGMRDRGEIEFSRVGRRVVYTLRSLEDYLKRHSLPARHERRLKAVS